VEEAAAFAEKLLETAAKLYMNNAYVGVGLLLEQFGQHVDERLSRRARFDRGGLLDEADERASRPVIGRDARFAMPPRAQL
jgi:hypothetical protein